MDLTSQFFNYDHVGYRDNTITSDNFETKKREIIDDLDRLKSMTVEEFTFYKKWQEIKEQNQFILGSSDSAKDSIWKPTDINNEDLTVKEINDLQPKVIVANNKVDENRWTILRFFCSTAEFNQAPGRFIKFMMVDEVTMKVLGICSIASDVISISDRDKYIGWTLDDKLTHKMLKHSAIGTTIVPTQPLGYNFLGGKLVASLVTSKIVRNEWEDQEKGESNSCKLVGMTTTSLYGNKVIDKDGTKKGNFSMYNSLKWWKPVGLSKGKISIQPSQAHYELWHNYVKNKYPDKYNKLMTQKEGVSGPVTGAKMRVLSMIFDTIGIKQSEYVHGFERGVYYSCFYENTKEFLCRKITEDKLVMKPLFDNDVTSIVDWWKPRAIERYKRLKSENRLNGSKLFYHDITQLTYEKAKEKYLGSVGR